MTIPTPRVVALHSAAIDETGAVLGVFLVRSDGALLNINLPLGELAARAHVVDPDHHQQRERALDIAAENRLRDAIRELCAGVNPKREPH